MIRFRIYEELYLNLIVKLFGTIVNLLINSVTKKKSKTEIIFSLSLRLIKLLSCYVLCMAHG